MKTYRTSEVARMTGIHPNTVRKYEEIGFISPVPRANNGYREYEERHIYQIKICRHIFDYGWLGREARDISLMIIKSMVDWDLQEAYSYAYEYLKVIENQYNIAKDTADVLVRWAEKQETYNEVKNYSRSEAAELIGVTQETLRNWERNGLIKVPRVGANKTRIYTHKEIERLMIINMLRQSKYSISAIFNSLKQYDKGNSKGVIISLNNLKFQEDVSWVFVGDYWIKALEDGINGAKKILILIDEINNKII